MNVLDLFSGIGAFALGMQRAGFRHAAFCEIDPFCRRVLEKHWPGVPCHHDIRALRGFNRVAGICGGFPCQPFSTASRGRRTAVDLWPEMQRLVDDVRPDWVIAENVQEEAIAFAAERLNGLGYPTYYRRISGADAGADHIRNRWWLIAHPDAEGELRRAIDAEVAKLPALCAGLWGPGNYARAVRVLDGPADRMDRVGSIGNAVFPQILELPWQGFVWMNPPFGARNGIVPWLEKFFAHGDGIALTPDRTSAPWWQQFAARAHKVLFVAPKLKFIGADGKPGTSPAQGTSLMAVGSRGVAALHRAADNRLGVLMAVQPSPQDTTTPEAKP